MASTPFLFRYVNTRSNLTASSKRGPYLFLACEAGPSQKASQILGWGGATPGVKVEKPVVDFSLWQEIFKLQDLVEICKYSSSQKRYHKNSRGVGIFLGATRRSAADFGKSAEVIRCPYTSLPMALVEAGPCALPHTWKSVSILS